jgi:amino acid transporter
VTTTANAVSVRKMTLLAMIAATYFMVAGGPQGLEDIVHKTGYGATLLILVITPLVWSVPAALMVSELATAIPEEGGFYVWVRRGLGPFMGYQEAWLSLAGSIFEMALYPSLFADYLGRFAPWLVAGDRGLVLGFAMIAVCTVWNLAGVRAMGDGSVTLGVALLAPFAVLTVMAVSHAPSAAPAAVPLKDADLLGGVLIAMWNYMGWDNLSTIAGEVESPQRTYTRAMFGALALVIASYLLPVAAVARAGLDPNAWTDGGWVDAARLVGGQALAAAVALAGILGAIGSFGALMMSFTRLPVAMARDGYLPGIFARTNRAGMPWVAIVVSAIFWGACYPLGFERNLILDVLLTGLSILLEFWALVALRIREPALARPYRVPGGTLGTVLIGIPPLGLMIATIVRNRQERLGATNELTVGLIVIAAGVMAYFVSAAVARRVRIRESWQPR